MGFSGVWDLIGSFLKPHGMPNTTDAAYSNITKNPVTMTGTINNLSFFHDGDFTTNNCTIKIHVNGVVQATLVAVAGPQLVDVFTAIGVAVNAGDIIGVEYDAGVTPPDESVVNLVIE